MLNRVTGVRVRGVAAQGRLARVEVGEVVDGKRRVAVHDIVTRAQVTLGGGGSIHGDGSAVHVVLLRARQLRGPCPGVAVGTSWDVGRNGDIVRGSSSAVLGGAAAFDGQDDGPAGGLGGRHVGRQSNLARATLVDGGASKGHGEALAGSDIVGNAAGGVEGRGVSRDLAGKVGSRRGERAVRDGILAIRHRVGKNHMSRSSAATDCQHSGEVLNEGSHDGKRLWVSRGKVNQRQIDSSEKRKDQESRQPVGKRKSRSTRLQVQRMGILGEEEKEKEKDGCVME